MRKLMFMLAAMLSAFLVFAAANEVVVKVSVSGDRVSGKVQKELMALARQNAVKKYLLDQYGEKLPEKSRDKAAAAADKYVVGNPEEEEEPSVEDGEVTAKYTVTINQEEVGQFLKREGIDVSGGMELFVMEEPPDAGQLKLGDDVGKFFFDRYGMFQRKIRDALVKKVNDFGFKVVLLENNENYEEFKKKDPVLVGVSYNVNDATRGFEVTPDFLRTVQENNPDAIAMYYRIDTLAFDADKGAIRTTVALSIKCLSDNSTEAIGDRSFELRTSNKQPDMLMDDFGNCVKGCILAILNGENMGPRMVDIVTSLKNAQERPKGPMKLVINCSNVDKKIKIKVRNGLKKTLVSAGLTTETKVVKDSLSCEIKPSDELGDLDDVWCKVSEILPEFLGEEIEISDDWAKKSGNTLTVTIGK